MAQQHATANFRAAAGLAFLLSAAYSTSAQIPDKTVAVPLQVDAGTPLRVYLTDRVWFRLNRVVRAKVAEPVWAFDRVVIPAGAEVRGRIVELRPVSKMARARALVGGDFTPLKHAAVTFTAVQLPGGKTLPVHTDPILGLPTIYVPPRPAQNSGSADPTGHSLLRRSARQARDQARAQTRYIYDEVRGQNKLEWLEEFLLAKLPYRPQWYRARTRFDAVLKEPLTFGSAAVPSAELGDIGTLPAPDAVAQMRLIAGMSSSTSRLGDKMAGVISEPLFSKDHKLLFPQGTQVSGKVTLAQRARFFHRGGKLRFAFEDVHIPQEEAFAATVQARTDIPTRAQLAAAEADPTALAIDSEGTARATESKTRFLRPAVAFLVAAKSGDNDAGRQNVSGSGPSNLGGRSLGGFSGFGALGIAASQGPREIGVGLGYYGLAWSLYSSVISKGREVTFEPNTAVAIRFGAPPRANKRSNPQK